MPGDAMRGRTLLISIIAVVVIVAGVMAYIYLGQGSRKIRTDAGGTVMASHPDVPTDALPDQARTASGAGGKLLLFYSGDMMGSLDPCG